MSGDTTSKNARAEKILGPRVTPEQRERGFIPFDCPCELGYWCPSCKIAWDETLQWSEYASMLWCEKCDFDWPSALCIRINDVPDESKPWENVGREAAVRVFLDTVEEAIRRSAPAPPAPEQGEQ